MNKIKVDMMTNVVMPAMGNIYKVTWRDGTSDYTILAQINAGKYSLVSLTDGNRYSDGCGEMYQALEVEDAKVSYVGRNLTITLSDKQ